jgi:hypothetical protein
VVISENGATIEEMRYRVAGVAAASALLLVVAAQAQTPPVVALKSAALTAKWKESWLTGSVRFSGTVTGPADLRASLRPKGGGKVAAAVDLPSVQPGAFGGTLTFPNRLLPKVYTLTISGTHADGPVKPVSRDVVLKAPPEGVVDRAWASRTKFGRPVSTIPGSPTEVWAHFHFVAPPRSRKVRNRWYSPNFRWYGEKKNKPWTRTVHTRLSAAKLDKGVWFAYMFAENRVVKRWRVRLG